MSMPGEQAPKMVEVEGTLVGPEADAARARLIAAGYNVESCELKKVNLPHLFCMCNYMHGPQIHCNQQPGCEELSWMENGFIQCFAEVDGRSARIMDYAPGQQLQPHIHDIDEVRAWAPHRGAAAVDA